MEKSCKYGMKWIVLAFASFFFVLLACFVVLFAVSGTRI